MTSTLTAEERATITGHLTDWGAAPELITQTLTDAAFGPGAIGWPDEHQGIGAGIGILVDETRDPELSALFKLRRQTPDDREFIAQFQAASTRVWAILCPQAPEALIPIEATLDRPHNLRRTFLLLASNHTPLLALLARPGTTIWLVPHQAGMREWAKEGAGTAYDLWAESLPLGRITGPMRAVELALQHVGYSTISTRPA